MTQTYIVLMALVLSVATACGAPAAQISDDAVATPQTAEQVRFLREEVDRLEGRRVLELDSDALPRMREWLDRMESASDEEAVLYEQAVRAQLDYLRTSELLYYADQADLR